MTELAGDKWFVVISGKREGPYDPKRISEMLLQGQITSQSFVWKRGMSDWLKMCDTLEFGMQTDGESPISDPERPVEGTTEPSQNRTKTCPTCNGLLKADDNICKWCEGKSESTPPAPSQTASRRPSRFSKYGLDKGAARGRGSFHSSDRKRSLGTQSRFRARGYGSRSSGSTGAIIALVSAGVGILSMFLPWISVKVSSTHGFFSATVSGFTCMNALFEVVIILLCLAASLIVSIIAVTTTENATKKTLGWIIMGAGGVALILFFIALARVGSWGTFHGSGVSGGTGWDMGFFLSLLCSIGTGAGGFITAQSKKS